MADWGEHAEEWAAAVLAALATEYPSAAGHVALGPDDCDVTPSALHPAFWGCLDWHSSVHMQWSALTLLDASGPALTPATRDALSRVLAERLTDAHAAVEADYLRRHPAFERPYGWGWAATLAAAASRSPQPDAAAWAAATRPLADAVFDLVLGWLPRLRRPVRTGVHDNTAFGLALVHAAAGVLGRPEVRDAVATRARAWFGRDCDYPVRWEPSGNDFLSAALCEAELMRRVLPAGEFRGWLAGFLPGLGASGDPLLDVPEVGDRTDGKLVHLVGLALSRAWHLRALAPHLDADRAARVAEKTAVQVAAAGPEIAGGDFMATHWLVSYALLAAGVPVAAEEPLSAGDRSN
nr:DUF2891 family protein [Propionibacterium sp.]